MRRARARRRRARRTSSRPRASSGGGPATARCVDAEPAGGDEEELAGRVAGPRRRASPGSADDRPEPRRGGCRAPRRSGRASSGVRLDRMLEPALVVEPSRASSSSSHHSSASSRRSNASDVEAGSGSRRAARDGEPAAVRGQERRERGQEVERRRGRRGAPAAGRSRRARPRRGRARLRETASAATNPSSPCSSKIAVRREPPRGSHRSSLAVRCRFERPLAERVRRANRRRAPLAGADEMEREVVREVAADADAAHAVARARRAAARRRRCRGGRAARRARRRRRRSSPGCRPRRATRRRRRTSRTSSSR